MASPSDEEIDALCHELELNFQKCQRVHEFFAGGEGSSTKAKAPRKLSKWQQCLAVRRKGQKFDPSAIKALAQEYKAGRCP